MSAWKKLSTINVNDKTEKKGQFTYLSWAWAWSKAKEEYPDANFELLDDIHYRDETVEVRVAVTIDGQTHTAFLPVLNHSNKPIKNPNSFDMNNARMRCLVKGLGLHGLGMYLYAGEDIPAPAALDDATAENLTSSIANSDPVAFMAMWSLLGDDEKTLYFNSAPQGHKTKFKDQVKEIEGRFHQMVDDYEDAIKECVADGLIDDLKAHLAEISEDAVLKQYVWNRLNPVDKQAIKEALA
jgi:hypothetical protein